MITKELKEGDEAYMFECILRRGILIKGWTTEYVDFLPLEHEDNNKRYRTVDNYARAIELMIEQLEKLKEEQP